MLRKLVVGLASAWLVLMPLTAHALGFGNIQLKSALNEPLNAQIDLISPTPSDIDSLKVQLASEGAFTRAGIDRPHFLSSLQFEVVERDGKQVIQVRSKQAIREPFVSFLLEFSWDNGRMLREYTMLLDPPGQMMREPAPAMAETPVTEEPTDTIRRDEPQPYAPEPYAPEPVPQASAEPEEAPEPTEVSPAPREEATAQIEVEDAEPAPATQTAARAYSDTTDPFVDDGSQFPRIDLQAYRESGDEMELGELDYGVTQKGDNAWTIAEKLQRDGDSVSIYQIMMALLQSNPDAFVDGNIHRLKSGQVLRIEDPALLNAMSREQAANEYMAQTEDWNAYRQAIAERTGRQAVVAEGGMQERPAQATTGGELTLSSPDGEDLQAGAGVSEDAVSNDLVALQDELRQLRENTSTTRERNVALNRQLQEMEEELARLQRSVSIKDDELAALQQQLAELNAQPALPDTPAETDASEQESVSEPEQAARTETEDMAVAEPIEAPAAPDEASEGEESGRDAASTEQAREPATPEVEPAPEPKGMVEEYLTMAKDIFNSAVDMVAGMIGASGNSLLMYVAAPVLLVLVILMLIVVRRRRQAEGNYQESILSGGPSTLTNSAQTGPDSAESSFLSDFAVSGAGAIQTEDSEVDPLTEADVFMAYGRYEAAEERLQEAIEQEPGRKELKLKLLELYSTTQNANAFENLAEEFYATLGGEAESDPQWEKVVAMGKELAPNNPLFAAGSAAVAASTLVNNESGSGLSDSQVMDIGLDTGVFENSDFAAPEQGGSADSELDFNLDFGAESDAGETTSQGAGDTGLDFNLESGSEDRVSSAAASDTGGDLDFNLDMGTPETPTEDEPAGTDFNLGAGDNTADDLDFNLDSDQGSDTRNDLEFNLDAGDTNDDSSLSLDLGSDTEAAAGGDAGLDFKPGDELEIAGSGDDTMAIDTGGLDFGRADEDGMDLDLDASDAADSGMSLGGGDEVGTKLDLARAYIDMGDPDGARSILDEVLDEGNDSQKQEAQQLLQQIA